MKKIFIALGALLTLTGCSTVTHYDAQGNVIKVERVTNFSRVMDGTNAKSQMMLVNGTFVGFEASATAGDNCTPGISVKYADGKVAVVNALTGSNFSGWEPWLKSSLPEKPPSGLTESRRSKNHRFVIPLAVSLFPSRDTVFLFPVVIGFEIAVNSDDKIIFFFTKSDNGFLSRVMKNNSLFTVFKIFRNLALQRIDWQSFKTAAPVQPELPLSETPETFRNTA